MPMVLSKTKFLKIQLILGEWTYSGLMCFIHFRMSINLQVKPQIHIFLGSGWSKPGQSFICCFLRTRDNVDKFPVTKYTFVACLEH